MIRFILTSKINPVILGLCFVLITGSCCYGLAQAATPIDMETEVRELVNAERKSLGLHPLAWDAQLFVAARLHSEDQAQMGQMSHTGSDGSSFSERARRAGYDMGAGGENVARGYRSSLQVFNAWMNSSGHRRNMMNASYCDIGVGWANGNYWTLVVGRQRGVTDCPDEPDPPPGTGPAWLPAIIRLLL